MIKSGSLYITNFDFPHGQPLSPAGEQYRDGHGEFSSC